MLGQIGIGEVANASLLTVEETGQRDDHGLEKLSQPETSEVLLDHLIQ